MYNIPCLSPINQCWMLWQTEIFKPGNSAYQTSSACIPASFTSTFKRGAKWLCYRVHQPLGPLGSNSSSKPSECLAVIFLGTQKKPWNRKTNRSAFVFSISLPTCDLVLMNTRCTQSNLICRGTKMCTFSQVDLLITSVPWHDINLSNELRLTAWEYVFS